MTPTAGKLLVRANLELDDEILRGYEQEAANAGTDVDTVISQRLERCAKHDATRGLYFDDTQRDRLERIIGKNVRTPEEAVALVAKMVVISVDKIKIHLKPILLARLQTRCFDKTAEGRPDFDGFVARVVRTSLEQYVGL